MIHLKGIESESVSFLPARILSDILNPLTLPLLVFGMAGWTTKDSFEKIIEIIGVSTLLFFVIPSLVAITIIKNGFGENYDFQSQTIRAFLYIISILSIGLGGFFVFSKIYAKIYGVILTIYLINLTVAFIINFKWKISVHVGSMVTAAVLLVWLTYLNSFPAWPILIAFIITCLTPIMAWARFQLQVHSWHEIFLGAATGFIVTVTMIFILTEYNCMN